MKVIILCVLASLIPQLLISQVDNTGHGTEPIDTLHSNKVLDEVIISASRQKEKLINSPAAINLITAKQFENHTGSPEELFALQKGVDFSRTGSFWSTMSIRGFNSAFNQKILMIDDNRIANLRIRTPVGPFSPYIKEDIERVEIILGPSSALYGPNSLNALLYTISKSPFTYQGTTVVLGVSSHNLFNARFRHAKAINNKWAYKITSEYLSGNEPEFTDSVYVMGVYQGRPEIGLDRSATFVKMLAAAFYKPTKLSEIGLNYALNLSTSMNGSRNNLDNWNNSSLQLSYKSPHWFAQIYKTWIILDNSTNSRARSLNYYDLLDQGQKEDVAFHNSLHGPRQTSLEENSYRYNTDIQYNHNWMNFNFIVGTQYQNENAFSNHTYLIDDKGRIILHQYGVYGQIIADVNNTGVKLIVASRADHHSVFGSNILPKAAITHTKNNSTWRITYGKGYLVPTLINSYQISGSGIILGNAEGFTLSDGSTIAPLKPETIKTLEIGFKTLILNSNLLLDAATYYNWSENLISPIVNIVPNGLSGGAVVTHRGNRPIADFTIGNPNPGSMVFSNINFGYAQTYGFDLGLKYQFLNYFNITLNYSLFNYRLDRNDLRNDANSDGKVTDNDLSVNTPRHKISSAFSVNAKKLNLTVFPRWVQKYDFFSGRNVAAQTNHENIYNGSSVVENRRVGDSFNYGQLGGFYISANANYQLTKIINLGAYVNNIVGKGNYEFVATAPTEATYGIELKFNF